MVGHAEKGLQGKPYETWGVRCCQHLPLPSPFLRSDDRTKQQQPMITEIQQGKVLSPVLEEPTDDINDQQQEEEEDLLLPECERPYVQTGYRRVELMVQQHNEAHHRVNQFCRFDNPISIAMGGRSSSTVSIFQKLNSFVVVDLPSTSATEQTTD
eukprot:GHVS01006719.1.p1 GENE.GHVS01006719.1~~GHVS01006719.1.p1  ORF type:complete len:169 (-),score=30.39 GHVS01006719.1:4-468(-)